MRARPGRARRSERSLAVRATKRIAGGVEGDGRVPSEETGWRITADEQAVVLASADAVEGPRAFAEKRQPVWQDR
ncbi:Clp protease/crotonase-like domain-containing protein [Streptomyces spongiae]|uniref:hypothetical protein n=1 Tax=Streptomyces spongiae TaxID=565072 RepID=UPI001D15237F|nr:hypothetical protein [Streptomyces spongiae]